MGQRFIHRVLTFDVAARIALVVSQRLVHTPAAVEDPTAQRGLRKTSRPQIFVAHVLKLFVLLGGVVCPVDVKREESDCEQHKQPAQCAQPSISGCRSETLSDVSWEIRRDRSDYMSPAAHQP